MEKASIPEDRNKDSGERNVEDGFSEEDVLGGLF